MTKHHSNRVTKPEDWETYYSSRIANPNLWQPVDEADFRNLPHTSLMRLLSQYVRGAVIEIGAGDSDLLIDIQKRFHPERCVGLDYLPQACKLLSERAQQAGATIETVCADLYEPPVELLGTFDLVMSYGVVEHFANLDDVIAAIARYAKPGGVVFTMIPNLKGSIYQSLMKRWNRKVYDAHVPYDATDLSLAHERAGLKIERCAYFLSSNFGMLSWCFADRPKSGLTYRMYFWLTRLSKLLWWFEQRFVRLPATSWFAPYIVCVAHRL